MIRWRTLYGTSPHQRISRELLTGAIAYRMQEPALGKHRPSIRRLLERIAGSASAGHSTHTAPAGKTAVGTVLIREWQGASHRVVVAEGAVVYRKQRYRSLSEVARRYRRSLVRARSSDSRPPGSAPADQ